MEKTTAKSDKSASASNASANRIGSVLSENKAHDQIPEIQFRFPEKKSNLNISQTTPIIQKQEEKQDKYAPGEEPEWSRPSISRFEIDCSLKLFIDKTSGELYTPTEMHQYYCYAKDDLLLYTKVVCILNKDKSANMQVLNNLKTQNLSKYEQEGALLVGEWIKNAFFEGSQSCYRTQAGAATSWNSEVYICSIFMNKPRNPFLAAVYWRHEMQQHQATCLKILEPIKKAKTEQVKRNLEFNKAQQEHIRPDQYIDWEAERKIREARAVKEAEIEATTLLSDPILYFNDELAAYTLTVEALQKELLMAKELASLAESNCSIPSFVKGNCKN